MLHKVREREVIVRLETMLTTVAHELGVKVYLVGGTVRDRLLGRASGDLDYAVSGDVFVFAEKLKKVLKIRTLVGLSREVGEEAVRLFWQGCQVDLAALREGVQTIEEDLVRRDFTINAMALPLPAGDQSLADQLLDPTGGQADLRVGVLRHLPGAFAADPLRLLRAFRLAAQLELTIAERTLAAVSREAAQIKEVAAERILLEINHILLTEKAAQVFRKMEECGLLAMLLPELAGARGVTQPQFHHLDVLDHSLLALACLEEVIANPGDYLPGLEETVEAYLLEPGVQLGLKWAALLHDVGKPETRALHPEEGRVTFYRHDERGAELVAAIGQRLRFSKKLTQQVATLVASHMHPFHLCNSRREGQAPSKKAALRLQRRVGEELLGLFLLAMADSLAGQGELKPPEMEAELATLALWVMEVYNTSIRPLREGPRLVTGNDLRDDFRLTPGPLFKVLLDELEAARVEGLVVSREDAYSWLRRRLEYLEDEQ